MVAISYDSPEMQQPFIDVASITYPILSDTNGSTAILLGILNEQYAPGDDAYGIPHPGIFVVDPEGEIVSKFFVEGYDTRVDGASVLASAKQLLGAE